MKSQGASKNAANNAAQAGGVSQKAEAAANVSAGTADVSALSVQLDLSKVKVEPLFEDMVDFETFSKSDFRVVKVKAVSYTHLRKMYDESGRLHFCVDETLRRRLETKLITKILAFEAV